MEVTPNTGLNVPSTYVSPLPIGEDFYFFPARDVYTYTSDDGEVEPHGNIFRYKTIVYKGEDTNGEKLFENLYEIGSDRRPIGTSTGYTIKLKEGYYTVYYGWYYSATGAGSQGSFARTFTFLVVQNRFPLKKWTVTGVLDRLFDLAEPIYKDERPRFRLQGVKADGTFEAGSQAEKFDKIPAPEFAFIE